MTDPKPARDPNGAETVEAEVDKLPAAHYDEHGNWLYNDPGYDDSVDEDDE